MCEDMPWCSDHYKIPNYPGATLEGMKETLEHSCANDWDAVIIFKNLNLKRTPGTSLRALSWNFVLDKEERER